MDKVTVIAAQGGTLRGPARVRLSKDQHARRIGILGAKYPRSGVFDIDGGQALQFKAGEAIGIEHAGRLNRDVFSWADPELVQEPPKSPDSGNADGSGDDGLDDDDLSNDDEGGEDEA